MTEHGHMDALTALLEERKRYETWIAELDARRAHAPGHVVERVRGDYAARLSQVTEQLVQRAPELRATAHELAVRLAGLERDEAEKRDERAEYELRAAVGEYADDVAQAAFAQCDEAIARFSAERQAIEGELTRMRSVLSAIDAAAAAMGEPAPSQKGGGGGGGGGGAASDLDELAFLKTVVPDSRLTPALANQAVPERESVPNEEAVPGAPPAYVAGRRSMGAEEARPLAGRPGTSGAVPSVLRDVPAEQVKTLRCQECGTLNYPTEWYCERCGGELAAM